MLDMTNSDNSVSWKDPRHTVFHVVHGYFDADGWIGGDCEFLLQTKKKPVSLSLKFWNPDFSLKYRQNRLHISVQEEKFVSPPVFLGEIFLFRYDFDKTVGKDITVKIRSEAVIPSSNIDQRERGVILASGELSFA